MTLPPTVVLFCCSLIVMVSGLFSGNVERSPICTALSYCGRGAIQSALKQFDEMEAFSDRRDIIDQISGIPRRCSCHPTCHYFGTCCNDAFDRPYHIPVHRDSGKNCLDIEGGSGARVIDACPFNARNKSQQVMCEDGKLERKVNGGYPIKVSASTLPYAVSVRTKLTYKNKHCALCMGERESEILEWKLQQDPDCKQRNKARCQMIQQAPKAGQHYGAHFLPLEFYRETTYLFRDSDEASTVCDIDIIDTCPRGSALELSNLCTFSTTSIVQEMLTKKVYNNVYCARCNNVQFLTGCEDLVEKERLALNQEFPTTESVSSTASTVTETSSISTSFTASSTSADLVSTTAAAATTGTTTTSPPDGTATSTTSTTSGSTTATQATNALNAGSGHPHGQQIFVDGSNPRGAIIPSGSPSSFPNGTVLVPDPNNPRGFAILPPGASSAESQSLVGDNSAEQGSGDGERIPHGTRLFVGPENPRGELEVPVNESSSGSGDESATEADDNAAEETTPLTTRQPMRSNILQRLINAVAGN